MLLDIEQDYDFSLFAVCSSDPEYRLCYELNRLMAWRLTQRNEDVMELDAQGREFPYSVYDEIQEERGVHIMLLSNRSWKQNTSKNEELDLFSAVSFDQYSYLISDQKKVDYWLIYYGDLQEQQKEELAMRMNHSSRVLTAYELNPSKIKSKEKLLHLKDSYE